MRILVTGANGQLGNALRVASVDCSDEYVFTDVAELDITDAATVRKFADGFDVIVNCAAYTSVDRAEDDRETADLLNHAAVRNLALAAKECGATLIHISTDYVFDGNANVPYTEDIEPNPTSVYGSTKLLGEQAVTESGCDHIIIRTAWLYSETGKNFVKTMAGLTADKDSLNVVFDQVGTPTYAGDLAGAIVHIIGTRQLDRHGIYHFTDEGVCSWYDFARQIAVECGHTCDIRPCHSDEFPSKVRRPHYSVLDKTKIKRTFGIDIPYWKDSLHKCIGNLEKH